MFVDHAVEAELVRQHVLVEAHIIEISAFFWIVHAARQVQPREVNSSSGGRCGQANSVK